MYVRMVNLGITMAPWSVVWVAVRYNHAKLKLSTLPIAIFISKVDKNFKLKDIVLVWKFNLSIKGQIEFI
jgi:hypothetical protein